MKKIIYILSVFVIVILTGLSASAMGDLTEDISDTIFSAINSDTLEILERFGISDLDSENIFNVSFKNFFEYYKDVFSELFMSGLSLFMKLVTLIVITGVTAVIIQDKKYETILTYISTSIAIVTIVDDINLCLSSSLTVVDLCGKFILSFAPVYAVIIALSGNPSTALTYNTLVLSFTEVASGVINGIFVEFIGCYFCLSAALSLSDTINLNRLLSATNRVFNFVLGLVSSVFASLLTVRGILSSSVDSVTSKGIRFALSSLVPVIGSSISEAYSSVLGSINVIKSSVAVVGILAVIIMSLPFIFETMIFYFSLSGLSFISEMFEYTKLSDVFRAFSYGVRIIGLISVFEIFLLIISTALMLTVKGG